MKQIYSFAIILSTLFFVGCKNLESEQDGGIAITDQRVETNEARIENLNRVVISSKDTTKNEMYKDIISTNTIAYYPSYIPFEYTRNSNSISYFLNRNSIEDFNLPVAESFDSTETSFQSFIMTDDYSNNIQSLQTSFIDYDEESDLYKMSMKVDNKLVTLNDDELTTDSLLNQGIITNEYTNDSIEMEFFQYAFLQHKNEDGFDFFMFTGVNKLDNNIPYYNFQDNTEKITEDNISNFENEYNYLVTKIYFGYNFVDEFIEFHEIDYNTIKKIAESLRRLT